MCSSDDKVEEGHLSSAFDITCRAWQVGRHFIVQTAVLTVEVATVRRPIYALWLSTAGQFLLHFSRIGLTRETGGHHREETKSPLSIVLSEEISNQPAKPRQLSARDAPQRS